MFSTHRFQIKFLFFIVGIVFLSTQSSYGKEPEWFLKMKNIKVFQSSKKDIYRIFDSPKVLYSTNDNHREKGWGETVEYDINDGKLEVYYSTGKCSELSDGWDIDKDTVVSIGFKPSKPVNISELNLDLKTFTRYKESDTQYFEYSSSELGINFSTLENKVVSFEFLPTSKMRELDCEKVIRNNKSSVE